MLLVLLSSLLSSFVVGVCVVTAAVASAAAVADVCRTAVANVEGQHKFRAGA